VLYDREVGAAVTQAARNYGVSLEPALVHAVIQRETSHGPYSPRGTLEPNGHRSWGPMQVQDSTAAMHGVSDPTTLLVPSIGIRIGTFELARLVKAFPGDTARAIAAYNAGAGNAKRSAAGTFVNQSYVDAVLGFWQKYRGVVTASASAAGLVALGLLAWFLLSRRRHAIA
jgi:soluble lytic murein transglycosylase-like protein